MGAEFLCENFVCLAHKKASHPEAHLFLYLPPWHSPWNLLKLKIIKILVKFRNFGFIENTVINCLFIIYNYLLLIIYTNIYTYNT
jgi:hypothetical protein